VTGYKDGSAQIPAQAFVQRSGWYPMVLCILNKKAISSLEPFLCPHWAMLYPHSEQFRIREAFRSRKNGTPG
jgi:hypothetical protein